MRPRWRPHRATHRRAAEETETWWKKERDLGGEKNLHLMYQLFARHFIKVIRKDVMRVVVR